MADEIKQPTVLVKKADGTFVRMSLADLKNQKKAAAPAPQATPKTVPVLPKPSVPKLLPKKEEPKKINNDFSPLLDEDNLSKDSSNNAVVPSMRVNQADAVIKSLSFTMPQNFFNRLRSIIQLRLKDVRGAKETREQVLRSIKDGGLGLTESQADELEKKTIGTLMVYSEPSVPATTAPFNSFVHSANASKIPAMEKKVVAPVIPTVETPSLPTKKYPVEPKVSFKINSRDPKPAMQDIVGKPVEMGPLEEIRYFTLTDLRRLSANPAEAVARFKQKFTNLKDESFLLFLDSRLAWRSSPLYQEYMTAVDKSLSEGRPLSAVTSDPSHISLLEIDALVTMEKSLGL